jgi:hypothetical protein
MSYVETMIFYVYSVYQDYGDMEEALDQLEDEIDFNREDIKEMILVGIEENE